MSIKDNIRFFLVFPSKKIAMIYKFDNLHGLRERKYVSYVSLIFVDWVLNIFKEL